MHYIKYCWNILVIFSWQTAWIWKLCAPSVFSSHVQLAIRWLLIHQKEATGFGRAGVCSVPTAVCKYRFLSWVSAESLLGGKNLYCLNLLPFLTSFFFFLFPPYFSLSKEIEIFFSVKSVTAQATSICLPVYCMGPSFTNTEFSGACCISALPFSDIGIYVLNFLFKLLANVAFPEFKLPVSLCTSMFLHINTTYCKGFLYSGV